jgi:hypothetical protein
MEKIRTLAQLQEALDGEMGWRIKEISNFKLVAKRQPATAKTFTRAGVALVYAHWEGFIKRASEAYLNFVDNQGCVYRELKTCFGVFGLKRRLALLGNSHKLRKNIEALEFILTEIDKPTRMNMSNAINTEANLTSTVFTNIASSLNISISPYETKFNLIDESLVRRRNKIAHGEYIDLGANEFAVLADNILQLMRDYKTDVENAASLSSYKRDIPEQGDAAG